MHTKVLRGYPQNDYGVMVTDYTYTNQKVILRIPSKDLAFCGADDWMMAWL
ncbi:MAG: hypothetical protein WD361_06300 [Gracilimonas sp.]